VPDLVSALAAGPGWPAAPPAPGPLSGVRVLDLSRVLAGPYCCMVLADLGADVLKVERPGAGDDTRRWGPPFHGDDAAYFFAVNRDRRSVALDLASEPGRLVVARLAATADVVVENFLPRHLERLGLAALRERTDAVWVSVRGAGGDGPDGERPGYDVMAQARSGLMSVTGTSEPTKVGVAVADVVAGLYAAVGALAGLAGAQRPLRVEVGLLEAAVSMLVNQASNALVGGRVPDLRRQRPPEHRAVRPGAVRRPAARGRRRQRRAVRALCARVGLERPGLGTNAGRVADRARCRRAGAGFSRGTAAEWAHVLDAAGVPCAVVQDLARCRRPAAGRDRAAAGGRAPAGAVRVVGVAVPARRRAAARAPRAAAARAAHGRGALRPRLSDAQVEEVTGG
jgi:crotonobetainyl-CoA:carnitine CoA-transferase CaiB-like acyl-CoA transferase